MRLTDFQSFSAAMSKTAAAGPLLAALSKAPGAIATRLRSAPGAIASSIGDFGRATAHGFTGATFGSPTLHRMGMEGVPASARAMGLTSIPGVARSLAKHPGKTVKELALGGDALHSLTTVGLPALTMAPGLMRGDESAQGGASLSRKLVDAGVGVGAGVLTSRMPILPGLVASGAATYGADQVMRRLAPHKEQP